MKKYLKIFGKALAATVLAVVAVALTGYLCTPVYDFADPQPFEGEALYNPYEGVDFGQAKKAIFHFHTTRSDGKDAPEAVVGAYTEAGYDIVSPADHDRVTPAGIAPGRELGTYEHGLNAYRFHNVVFGAGEPMRFQLPLWQNCSGREDVLRRLSERFPIVVLNHPATVRGLSTEQLTRLSHYDYIEADRGMSRDVAPWDVALSAGHYSFVMANDDLHDLGWSKALGRAMTMVMTPGTDAPAVMEALAAGHTYAARTVNPVRDEALPRVTDFRVAGDTLRVAFSEPAEVSFKGQGGVVRASVSGAEEALCVFGPGDTYLRVEARFPAAGGTTLYLNPVARWSPGGGGDGGDEGDDEDGEGDEGDEGDGGGDGSEGGGGDEGDEGGRPVNASYSTRDGWASVLWAAGHGLLIIACLAGIYSLFRQRETRRV